MGNEQLYPVRYTTPDHLYDILDKLGMKYDLDLAVTDLRSYCLLADGGGIFAHYQSPGVYEIHTQFLPECRGVYCVRVVRNCLHYMFTKTPAEKLVSLIRTGDLASLGLVRLIHGKPDLVTPDGTFYSLTKEAWSCQSQQ